MNMVVSCFLTDFFFFFACSFLSLFAQLCKKHTRLIEQIRVAAIDGPQETLQENGIKALESDIDQDYVSRNLSIDE